VWLKNKEEFMKRCERCCELSIEKVFQSEEGSSLKFQKPIQAHQEAYNRIIQFESDIGEINNDEASLNSQDNDTVKAIEAKQKELMKINYIEWFLDGVNRLNEGLPIPGLISPYLERKSELAPHHFPLVEPPSAPKTPLTTKLKANQPSNSATNNLAQPVNTTPAATATATSIESIKPTS
jgi:hypothetical protein